jgi:hypothetical protein
MQNVNKMHYSVLKLPKKILIMQKNVANKASVTQHTNRNHQYPVGTGIGIFSHCCQDYQK